MKRFIFVCSGNICRSPMAEGLARHALSHANISAHVVSMGVLGIFGQPAAELAVEVSAENDIDISGHASQGVSIGMLHLADAVIVMEMAHKEHLLSLRRDLTNIYLMGSFDSEGGPIEIADPMGGPKGDFELTYKRLVRCVRGLVDAIGQDRI